MILNKQITPIVRKALQENRDARNSYNMLFVYVMAEYGLHLDQEQQEAFLAMPSVISIDRIARKLWETELDLRPTEKIRKFRNQKANEYREEMKGQWFFTPDGIARFIKQGESI